MSNYFDLQNAPVLTTASDLTVPKITTITYPGDDTAADPAGGQTITLTGAGFEAGASVIINGNAVGVVSVVSSTTITFTSPANSAGSYPIYVVNTDGGTAIAVPGIQYSGTPNWTTAAGSLGSYTETVAISNTVTATGDNPITYSLFSGSLPTGATLNSSTGLISGTSPLAASPTTFTFTIRATDAQLQDTNRQFSLTINPDVVTWSSPANGTTYTSVVNSAISNVALSATAASGQNVSYSANALPAGLSISGSNITGTPTVVANSSTLLTATAATTNATATRTINWVISVASDTFFPYVTALLSASTPASTFVTDASTNAFAVTVNGDTRPSNFGPYTPGYYSNFFDGDGDYLTTPSNAALAFGSGDFCLEFWMYPTAFNSNTSSIGNSNTWAANSWSVLNNHSTAPQKWTFFVHNYNSSSALLTSTSSALLNAWTHVAITRSGSSWRMFINGVQEGSTITSSVAMDGGSSNIFYICGSGNPSSYTPGYMSNVRAVKGAAVYTSNFTPSTTPLTAIANTSLLTCQSNRFIDNSTNNFTITRFGDTLVSGFDPFVPSSSFAGRGSGFFDGTGDELNAGSNAAFSFGTGAYTVEFWTYLNTAVAAGHMPCFVFNDTTNGWGIYNENGAGQLQIASRGVGVILGSSTTLTPGIWNHVVAVRSGTGTNQTSIFVNGSRIANGTDATNWSITGPLKMGGITIANYYLNGYLTNVRVVKGTAVYDPTQTTITVPSTPLTAIANTQLLTLQNNQPNNNNMFLDSSTNNFNITRNGNTTQGSFSPYGGGWSNFFNGSTDYFSMSDNNAFQYGAGEFALECWVYPPATPATYSYIVSQWFTADKGIIFGNINGFPAFYYSTTGSNDLTVTSSTVFPVNQWSHLMACRTGNTISLYLNGTRVATTTESGTLYNSTSSIGIATHIQGFGSYVWSGYISNLRSIAGSSPYNATQTTITVPTAPLTVVANTRLLICADNRFIDDGPSNFTLTRAGTPSIQRFNPFNPVLTTPTSYSGYFDGNGDYLSIASNAALSWGTGDYTVEAWVYLTSAQSRIMVVSGVGNFAFFTNSSANIIVGRVGTDELTSTGTVTLNQWVHIAATRSSNTTRIFINGTLSSTPTSITTNYGQNLTYIGSDATIMTTGYISNFRAVKGTALYTSNFTPSTTPLTAVANTSLLTLQSPTFIDNSTNNLTITNNGDTAPRQLNPFGWTNTTGSSAAYTPALYSGSAYFDGNNDYLSIGRNSMFLPVANEDFTIEAWIYLTATPSGVNNAQIVGFGEFGSDSDWAFIVQGDVRLAFNIGGTAYVNSTVISLNTWNHVAVSRSGTASNNLKVFVNGVGQSFSTNATTVGTGNRNLSIGADQNGDEAMWPGYISDIRITKGQGRYTSNFAPPVAPLTALANTTLLTNMTGASIYDSAMMGNYETVNTAQISTSVRPFGSGGSIAVINSYLDGCAIASSPQFAFGTGNWTVEGWFYTSQSGSTKQTLVLNLNQTTGMSMSVSTTSVEFRSNGTTDISGSGVSSNTWTYIAWVRNGNTVTIYRNGTSIVSGTYTNSIGPSAFYVGPTGGQSGVANTFNYIGYIADLRITRGVARYTSNFTPPSTPFITN